MRGNQHRIRLLLPALLIVGLLGLVPGITAQTTPVFESAACPVEAPDYVECGYLYVPENRADPNSDEIALAVAIVRASGTALPDPIVYLEGGPGGSALTGLDAWLDTIYNENRDVILIDQRGTGYSEPGLFCDEAADSEVADATACRRELEAQGIDLAAYTSASNAADIADLRVALGYDEINLYGVSYGTRLAMTIMRDYPQGIRSVVLDSPFPPAADAFNEDGVNFYYALQTLAADCAADAACNAAFPDIEGFFVDLVERANNAPLLVDGEEYSGGDIIEMFYGYFYDTPIIPYLPAILYDLAAGRFDALDAFEDSFYEDEGFSRAQQQDEEPPIDFDAMSDAEFDAFLMSALGYDNVDDLYDYLDSLTDDEYFALLDELAYGDAAMGGDMGDDMGGGDMEDGGFVDFDAMSDAEFDAFLMSALGYDNVDDLYDYLDSLTDDEYFALLDELGGGDMGGDFTDEGGDDGEDRSDAQGMFNSVTCAEEIPFSSAGQQAALMANLPDVLAEHFAESLQASFEVCAAWGVPLSGPIEDEIVVSDIPTLILVGQYDVATPPMWAALAAQGLRNALVLEFPGAGHGIIDATDCAREIGVDFVNDPLSAPDTTCLAQIGAPDFYLP